MMKKLMHNTVAAAGFAALLLVGACASTNNADANEATRDNDDLVHVTQTSSVTPASGPALVDSDGNVYSSSAAPGAGNAASVGTNTNVNIVPNRSRVDVATTSNLTDSTMVDNTASMETTSSTTVVDNEMDMDTDVDTSMSTSSNTTMQTTTTTVPMTSSVQSTTTTEDDDDTTTTTTATTTRTRMRKD